MITKYCSKCKLDKSLDDYRFSFGRGNSIQTSAYCKDCTRVLNRDYVRNRAQVIKKKIIFHYSKGSNCCACCGETIYEFLTIDHINGNGRKHRAEIDRRGYEYYLWIVQNNYPDGLRILCMNCNFSLGMWGYCPHDKIQKSSS